MKRLAIFLLSITLLVTVHSPSDGADCVSCHERENPGIVSDWKLSRHAKEDVGCDSCHGSAHTKEDDVSKVSLPTPDTCSECHEGKVKEYLAGKHAKAWVAMNAMPTVHYQPMELIEGKKGCGGCHKIGVKSDDEVKDLKGQGAGFGVASCDSCHTRHTFSVVEARQPEACQTCHMGFDHPQWEMYISSKHGVRHTLKESGALPEGSSAPVCQTCHMPDGNHEVRTAWGFLAVRLPLPEDEEWRKNQVSILQGLGVLDPEGNPTGRLDAVKAADVARLDAGDWERERKQMIEVCSECHSENFARTELEKGDRILKAADALMGEAIRIVAGLYKDGILKKSANYAYSFPDLLAFHDAPTTIEQVLFKMYLKHRMRAFQGAFHANPDYALWYGWSAMRTDLVEIRELARELREMKKE